MPGASTGRKTAALPKKPELLILDTSAAGVSLGLERDGRLRRVSASVSPRHDETLWRLLDRLLKGCGSSLRRIGAVAASRGPGRFTGVRVGLTFATMLSQSLGIPAVGVSLLDALAESCAPDLAAGERLLCVVPAIRRETYFQLFRRSLGAIAAEAPPAWSPLDALPAAAGAPLPAVAGVGAAEAARLLGGARVLRETGPDLSELARLAREELEGGGVPASLSPMYLKPATYQVKA